MKRTFVLLITLTLLFALPCNSFAAGVTVRTASTLFDIANAGQAYMDALSVWESASGNTIEDYSGLPADAWQPLILKMLDEGTLDVLQYRVGDADAAAILDKVVPLDEVNAAYPNMTIPINPLAAEADGKVYAVPVSFYWEALYCNKDLFETNGLELPTDWNKLGAAVMKFRELGIPPIAASFTDVPNYLAEIAILISGSSADQSASPQSAAEAPASWSEGMKLLAQLNGAGAFGPNATQTTEAVTTEAFRTKEAAMQFDGSWLASSIPEESWNSTVVVPFPVFSPAAESGTLLGSMSDGFYITRAAWNDPARREAAVSLLQALTQENLLNVLGERRATDALGDSIKSLLGGTQKLVKPIGERMKPEARDLWFAGIKGIVEGSKDPAALMQEVIDSGAFAQ